MIVVKSAGTGRCSALFTDAFQPHEIERPEFVANLFTRRPAWASVGLQILRSDQNRQHNVLDMHSAN
jgi:hypothetical protein